MTIKKDRPSRGKTEAELLEDLRALSVSAAHEFLLGFDRLRQLRDSWETDENGSEEEARAEREKAKGLAYEMAREKIKHAEALMSLSHAQADVLFEHARRLVRGVRRGSDDKKKPLRVLDFELRRSEPRKSATLRLSITNPFAVTADARFVVEKFAKSDGELMPAIKVDVSAKPAPPNGHCDVDIKIPFEAKIPVGVYFAELQVFLVGEVEERVARRALRLRVSEKATPGQSV